MDALPGVERAAGFELLELREEWRGDVVQACRQRFKLPSGAVVEHDVIALPPVVTIVPLLGDGCDGPRVVLVHQIRHALGGSIHELPAGHIEPGESPAEAAGRELREETGYTAGRLTALAVRHTIPGVSRQVMHFYLAEGLVAGEASPEESESLRVRELALDDLVDEILTGPREGASPRVVDTKTHLALLHVAALRRRGASER